MDPRQALEQRADIVVNDLNSNGGLLPKAVASKFISEVYAATPLFSAATQERMPSHTWAIPRVGFTGQILMNDPGESTALADGDRKKITTYQVELVAKQYRGEVWLPYNVLEDNVEGQAFQTTVLAHIAKQVGLDLANCALNGDSAGLNATDEERLLHVQDGWFKKFASNAFDANGASLDDEVFAGWYKTMPRKYLENNGGNFQFFVQSDCGLDWRRHVTSRQTVGGDAALTGDAIPNYAGKKVIGDVGIKFGAKGLIAGMFVDPKNLIVGIYRDITIEAWKDIRKQVIVTVVSIRACFSAYQPGAIVLATGLLPKN